MRCIVMPGGKVSGISYRVKCVAVESERVFNDVLVTQQTGDRLYWANRCRYPDSSRRKPDNLTKEVLDTPDFMAMNRKRNDRNINVEVETIPPVSNNTSTFDKNSIPIGNGFHIGTNARREDKKIKSYPAPVARRSINHDVVVSSLVDQLLLDIYGYPRSERRRTESDSTASSYRLPTQHRHLQRARLLRKSKEELSIVLETLRAHVNHAGGLLVRQLRRRDYLAAKRDKSYDVITAHLQAYSAKRSEDTRMRFSLTPQPGESGFTQWLDAMKMVARLQGGIPPEFRKRLWLTLAERHLDQRGVDWKQAEKLCFNEWSNPDDEELGIQIVKDLHRTGCSLFCGAAGRDNQAVLRRVLLGFARWNKSVGYCQGLNVLAAFVLQVTDRAESSAVKVMIYLIEGVLPEGYFADNLRGLSIDMAVFRDLLRMRLPKLSRHLEALQCDAKDKATGSSYEPPLTNVFTMQWFLTLFCHCLPQEAVLRVWDLIFLEGDEVLLRTALAIWEGISERIMTVTSADEFYSIMGVLTREMLEFTDVNHLIKTIVSMGPLYGVTDLREKHRYNITPWARRLSDEEDTDTEDEERLAVAAAMFGVAQRFKKDRSTTSSGALQTIGPASERERIALDISTLKHQYAKLRERQRQAHIILSAACARQSMVPSTSQAMNHLLVGKSALISAKTRQLGPPPGAIPPKPRTPALHSPRIQGRKDKQGVTLHWKDTKKSKDAKDEQSVGDESETTTTSVVSTTEGMSVTLTSPRRPSATDSDSDSTSTELCDEPDRMSDVDSEEPTSTSDCYVMATDDEKSPRPGTSPIGGNTPIRQTSGQSAGSALQVQVSSSDAKSGDDDQRRELLNVDASSTSIAMITDQIRRLSTSNDVIATTASRVEEKKERKDEEAKEGDKAPSRKDDSSKDCDSTAQEHVVEISPVRDKLVDFSGSDQVFETLDSYDFSSNSVPTSDGNDKLVDTAITDVYGNVGAAAEQAPIVGKTDFDLSGDFMKHSESIKATAIVDTSLNSEDNTILSHGSIASTMSSGKYEKDGLIPTDLPVASCSAYRDVAGIESPVRDQSAASTGERTLFSGSYVIGHLPIAPTNVNEKLGRAAGGLSPMKDIRGILGEDIRIVDIDTKEKTPPESIVADVDALSKVDGRNLSREFASFDSGVGTRINKSFETASIDDRIGRGADFSLMKAHSSTLSEEGISFVSSSTTKINMSVELVEIGEKKSKDSEFSPMNDNAGIFGGEIKRFDSGMVTKISTSFDTVPRTGNSSRIAVVSPLEELETFGEERGHFDGIIRRNTDTVLKNDRDDEPEGKSSYSYRSIESDSTTIRMDDFSPLSKSIRISSGDLRFDSDLEKNIASNLDRTESIFSQTKIEDTSSPFSIADPVKNEYKMISYEVRKSIAPAADKITESAPLTEYAIEADNGLEIHRDSMEIKLPLISESETEIASSTSIFSESRKLIGKATTVERSTASKIVSNSLSEKKSTIDDRMIDTNLSLIGIGSSRPTSDYVYRDSLSTKFYDDQKTSPKTPESTHSFSSGETMGPDSKASSLATSPRTPNRADSRNFATDKSARSSVSSDSKTLTLRSMDSDVGSTRTKLNRISDAGRPSLDKSSPSTPMSTDSLKNKSGISPKFVISSSSESCSPGKVKSSDRSFSSELQSPISANSIKYRTNYPEGPDNLSESPMDICSAASPFYPIVYPNQKTPSPYDTTPKQRSNTDSTETSPEQKSTSSKEVTPLGRHSGTESLKSFKSTEVPRTSKDNNDDYDSARPFEKELADTLSSLPMESISRTKIERTRTAVNENIDLATYRTKNTVGAYLDDEISDRYAETDTVSPLPGDKYENRSAFVDKTGAFKIFGVNERDPKYLLGTRDSLKPFERSCSSLEKRFGETKLSPSSEEFGTAPHKKRSSDILEDLRHLEAKTSTDGKTDTSMLTRKTGYDWEDLKNLEARRQDNFSDSASEFSRGRLDVPSINVFGETRKSYVVEPKINLAECSILKSYARKKSNGEPDDDRESKLGVWTKVKPRAGRDNGRRSSDRALKIIQENSAILHKILTCQAKKRLPDLEEISKEITISPINEEISKIFSPILEKMGLNEHEINEELARINFKEFDQMTATSGSEFDAKMNDELSKLSLIDDNEIVDHLDVDDVISRDYLDTREALIDRQINEELSKLLANYEEASPICIANREEASSCQNPSEQEGLELSNISNNVFSYQSSNDSIETKSELGPIQDSTMQSTMDNYSQYTESMSNFVQPVKYNIRSLSPRSDIDIYRELEKLDKISSGEILPSASSSVSQKIISPMSYSSELRSYPEVRPSLLECCAKPEKTFDPSPMKSSPYDTYKPYEFKSRISPRKTPSNPYSARSYEKSGMDTNFDFHEDSATPSRLYDLGTSRPILSKETLEFRVRYDDESSKQIRDVDLTLEPYQNNLVDLERGASYYTDETPVSLKRLSTEAERPLNSSMVSPLEYAYNPTDMYLQKYDSVSTTNYPYPTSSMTYEKQSYDVDEDPEVGSYLSMRRKNSQSLSPNYQYADRDFAASMNPYTSDLSPSLEDPSKRPVSHPEFPDKISVAKYAEVPSRDSLSYRKASMSLGPLNGGAGRNPGGLDTTPSPRSLFSPFPVRNPSRQRKELGLKLGLYSPSSPGSTSLKRT